MCHSRVDGNPGFLFLDARLRGHDEKSIQTVFQ